MDDLPHSASVTEAAYNMLRHALLTGDIMPGERLKIGELSVRLAVNLSAMREALTRLAGEGMLVAEPQRGFSAAPVSAEDLQDLTRVRIDIETICIARSIEHGTVAWESGVVAAAHALSRTPKPNGADNLAGFDDWRSAHVNFHDALTSACGSPWLLRLRGQLNLQNQRYLSLSLKLSSARIQADDEHRNLAGAALARDVEAVTALITEHFWVTTRNLLLSPILAVDAAAVPRIRGRSRAVADQDVS